MGAPINMLEPTRIVISELRAVVRMNAAALSMFWAFRRIATFLRKRRMPGGERMRSLWRQRAPPRHFVLAALAMSVIAARDWRGL
jgi:hypothetical protein